MPRLDHRRVGLRDLFLGFLVVSLCGFGGPMVWARRTIVERRAWLDDIEFAEILSFCQFLPGPNVVSIAVCVGARLRGGRGALAALAGFILIPWTLGFAIGALCLAYAHVAVVQGALRGIAAVAAGMIVGAGLRLLLALRARPAGMLCAALAFAGLALAKLSLPLVVAVLVPLSIAAAGRRNPVTA